MPTAPSHNTTDARSLEIRLEEANRVLAEQVTSIRRGNRLTLIVGILALLLMAGYFTYGYSQISELMQPDTLVTLGVSQLEDHLPEARRAIETEITTSAPVWAEQVSARVRGSLPEARTRLEGYVLTQVDTGVVKAVELTEQEFRDFLRANRQSLDEGFRDLATSPQLADESLERLVVAINTKFQSNMQHNSKDLFETLNELVARLSRLKANQALTQEEALLRQIIMQARRMQFESKAETAQQQASR